MFLVDDDEPHVAQGREQRAAGAYDHARLAAADEVPLVVALALPHARMHDGHQVAEAAAEARHGLGRERYLAARARRPCARPPESASMACRYTSVLPEPVTPSTTTTSPRAAALASFMTRSASACPV